MLFGRLNRILMNAVDASNGGGAPAPATNPTAQPGAAPAPVDIAAIEAAAEKRGRDSAFAEARRTVEGKQPAGKTKAKTEGEGGAQAPSLTALRSLDRAVARSGRVLSDSQHARLERAFSEESPESAEVWLKDYFDGFSANAPVNPPTAPNPAAPVTTAPKGAPASNGGSPPPPTVPIAEQDLLSLSKADVDQLIATKGVRWVSDELFRQSANKRITVKG